MAHAIENEEEIEGKFRKMNARVRLEKFPVEAPGRSWNGRQRRFGAPARVQVNVLRDGKGEYFHIRHRTDVRIDVLDVKPKDRHLLVMAHAEQRGDDNTELKSKFLCGHDERAWFVAAIPETARARNVQDAKDALKPQAVWDAIERHGVSRSHRDRRRTRAFVRQGEWFFIPHAKLEVIERLVLRNEPIRRGAGKPHVCQFLFRQGGENVWVSARFPNGITTDEFLTLPEHERKRPGRWMARDARVFVKGAIRHPDHETVWLDCWHEVIQNTEHQAKAMEHVAFLD